MAVGGLKMSLLICCLTNEIFARTKTRSLVEKLNVVTSSTTTSDWDGVWQSLVVDCFRQLCYCLIEKKTHMVCISGDSGLAPHSGSSRILHTVLYSTEQCFSTGVLQEIARRSAGIDRSYLERNSQPQFYAVVAIPLFHKFIPESRIDAWNIA